MQRNSLLVYYSNKYYGSSNFIILAFNSCANLQSSAEGIFSQVLELIIWISLEEAYSTTWSNFEVGNWQIAASEFRRNYLPVNFPQLICRLSRLYSDPRAIRCIAFQPSPKTYLSDVIIRISINSEIRNLVRILQLNNFHFVWNRN